MSQFKVVKCYICGKKVTRRKSRIKWETRRNPDYKPVCSSRCRGIRRGSFGLKKRKTCNILKDHRNRVKNDTEHLTTERIVDIMCDTKPKRRAYHSSPSGIRKPKPKASSHHKGYVSKERWVRRELLVRGGKASWLSLQLLSLDDAIEVAGI